MHEFMHLWTTYCVPDTKCIYAGCWGLTPVILATWEAEIWSTEIKASPGLTRVKWTGGVLQVAEALLQK
jgi:hypothetical protein